MTENAETNSENQIKQQIVYPELCLITLTQFIPFDKIL